MNMLLLMLSACLVSVNCSPLLPSSIHKTLDMVTHLGNRTLQQNLKSVAGLTADAGLVAALTPLGARVAKEGLGLAGEALVIGSNFAEEAIKKNTFANRFDAKMLFDTTELVGGAMSEYGGGDGKVRAAIDLAGKVAAGNMTVGDALRQGGVALADHAMADTKLNLKSAAMTMEATGGIVGKLGDSASVIGSTSVGGAVSSIDNVLSKVGADKVISAAFKSVDKVLKTNIEDSVSAKIVEIDSSTAPLRDKIKAAGRVLDTIAITLRDISNTTESFGDASVTDYPSFVKEALSIIKV